MLKNPNEGFRPLLSLSWQSLAYGVGILGRQLAVYLALPLITGIMPQEQYGIVAVMSAFLAFLNVLTNAGLPAATFRLFNDNSDKENQRLTLGAGQQLIAAFALVAGLVMVIFARSISTIMFGTPDGAAVIRVGAVQLFIESLVNYGTILLRLEVRPLATSLQSLVHVLAQLGLAILFVVRFRLGALGYFYGFTAGAVIGLLYMLWLVKDSLSFKLSQPHIAAMVKYGLPLIPATLSIWALNLADRAFISWILGLDPVAVYDVGYRIGLIAGLASIPFNTAWPQFAFSIMNKEHARWVYQHVLTFCATLYVFIALGVIAVEKYVVSLLAPRSYEGAVNIVPWVALGQVAWGLYPILVIGLHITKKTNQIALITVIAAVVNILMNLILLPWIGIVGGAIATLGAYGALAAAAYIVGQRYYPFLVDWGRLGKLAMAAAVTGLALLLLDRIALPLLPDLLFRGCSLALFSVVLILSNFVSIHQLQGVWKLGKGTFQGKFGAP